MSPRASCPGCARTGWPLLVEHHHRHQRQRQRQRQRQVPAAGQSPDETLTLVRPQG